MTESKSTKRKGMFYLLLVCLVWLAYTLIAEMYMTEPETPRNNTFVSFLGQFTLSLFLLPQIYKLCTKPISQEQIQSLHETFTSASKVALLLLICNFTYNIGILDGSVTTADLIQTSIPNFVWLISLFYTVPGEQPIYTRTLKVLFFVIGLIGIAVLCFSDY